MGLKFNGLNINENEYIKGEIFVPADKSITHRVFMLASICEGKSYIKNPLLAEDCYNTLKALNELGVKFEVLQNNDVIIEGLGLKNFKNTKKKIDMGNSGTGIRLLTGLLVGQKNLEVTLTGDASLVKRPMNRIIIPLEKMGAEIFASENKFAPLKIYGKNLHGIRYELPIASAQIKSCLLLAGLFASSPTTIIEKVKSRNHTENMFKYLGIDLKINGLEITLSPLTSNIKSKDFFVPSDISSAAFFIVLGILASKNGILIKNVGLNPTRIGILNILKKMGANIKIENEREVSGEKIGDVFVKKSHLYGVEIYGADIPNVIDEIPIISVAAIFAKGKTIIKDAHELRYKECDRISAIKSEFSKFGAEIEELKDGLIINGNMNKKLTFDSIKLNSFMDHRIAMCEVILGVLSNGKIEIDDIDCINTSFPTFFDCLNKIGVNIKL
ncbi:MAG: 3-phosphoshikimate 1-carboxyvinyltransferase [Elusimicrobiota bacterium]|jgi:3-phosphoshikimate 1-carboxyvinyltransferase|nr:3-phosphoshikimate 1-carboxyvinyltransferase [Elusimicrobiota bacterium]